MPSKNELDEKFEDVTIGNKEIEPVTGAGGPIKKKLADLKKEVDPEADSVDPESFQEDVSSFETIFEGMDLSEEFKDKISLVFESAVNEKASIKAKEIAESIEIELKEEMETSIEESIEEIVENLDKYLDYATAQWMKENEIAIEAGIKVEMAESFMEGLKTLFLEHNLDIDQSDIDVISGLEEQSVLAKEKTNELIEENIALKSEVDALYATIKFNEISEGLTVSQKDRLKALSENLDFVNLNSYSSDLRTLKETFFNKKDSKQDKRISDSIEEEAEILTEDAKPTKRLSESTMVNALAQAMSRIK